jgi:hypothetical protein
MSDAPPDRTAAARPRKRWRWLGLVGAGILLAVLLYYPVGAWRAHVIDDDPAFSPRDLPAGASKSIGLAAALVRREIDGHGWAANKPFFMPVAILADMPSYQEGMVAAIRRFAIEMDVQFSRDDRQDADLRQAVSSLQYPPDVWMVNPAAPWEHTISTEKHYRNGARGFEAFNQRVAGGHDGIDFGQRADVLRGVLLGFADDLDATAADLDQAVSQSGGWFERRASRNYYAGKGHAYAILVLTRALAEDFAALISERRLEAAWRAMDESLAAAALPRPWLVMNGAATSTLIPNHLTQEGFHLLRGQRQMTALADALQ